LGIYDGLEDGEGVDGKLDENYGSSKTRRVKCVLVVRKLYLACTEYEIYVL
jgi:hypothetical protein